MRIKKAEYIDGHKIKLLFNDGITKVVDFEQFLSTTRKLLIPLLDLDYFKSFCLDEITICWPNGLDFSPDSLYEIGKDIQEQKKPVKAKPRIGIQRKKSGEKAEIKYQSTALAKRVSKKAKI